jgi:hypothetical protein
MTISSTTVKNSYSGDGSTTTFSYTFKIFQDSDIQVIIRSSTGTETTKTITTHYTVTGAGSSGGGSVVFTTGNIPTSTQTVVLRRNIPQTQAIDYIANDPFPAESHEEGLDRATMAIQQLQEEVTRSIKLSKTNTMTSTEFTVGATDRANKILAFDTSGELAVTQELGTYKGNWTTATTYYVRDLIKDTSNNNIYICNTAHTSTGSQPISSNADVAKWSLIVDAASASTSANAASNSASNASNSANTSANHASNSSNHASNSSNFANNSSNSANSSATYLAGVAANAANSSNFANNSSNSANSASNHSSNSSNFANNSSNSANTSSNHASNSSNHASNASNSANSASTSATTATTQAGYASSNASTATTQAGYATSNATAALGYSSNSSNFANNSSNHASNSSNFSNNSSNFANTASNAANAANSARDSALAAYDNFDDRYLGSKTSDPTLDNDGNALAGGALYFNSVDNVMKVYTGSAWVAAYASLSGALLVANNLSDLASNSSARTNLGLGTISTLSAPSGTVVGTSDSQTLTNKTLTTPVISSISNTGTLTLPTSTDTLVGRATTDTLTNKTLTLPTIDNIKIGYSTTATAAGTTTLTVSSNYKQYFTGSTTQTIVLPVVTTLTLGHTFEIHNNSTGSLTVNSSGSNLVGTIQGNTTAVCTCILVTGTTAASWDFDVTGFTSALATTRGGTGLTSIGTSLQVLRTNTGATALEFATISTGTAWQSVQTTGFTATAGYGYPCNTTSAAFTVTLPASPSVGDTIILLDYAGTFDTNALTINPNSNKIEGGTSNLVLSSDREGVNLTYIDSTQGWLASSGVQEGTDALVQTSYSIDFLVIAGGGAGGDLGGGGGAGGYRTSTQTIEKGTAITITVGDGGADSTTNGAAGGSGSASSISGSGITTISSAGGGGGGGHDGSTPGNKDGKNGGSGGGGAQSTTTNPGGAGNTPSTSPSQGNNGGTSYFYGGSIGGAGGGGGASAVGGDATTVANSGAGGAGTASSITGSSVTRAGGGGGGGRSDTSPATTGGSGGSGGGGAGSGGGSGTSGTANTGSGGGGGGYNGTWQASGNGGKGVVILSMVTTRYTGTTTGSPTVTTSGSNTILQFNGSGSYTA